MALTPGTRLGVYQITAPLGEGGMGQVWHATDTTLGRRHSGPRVAVFNLTRFARDKYDHFALRSLLQSLGI